MIGTMPEGVFRISNANIVVAENDCQPDIVMTTKNSQRRRIRNVQCKLLGAGELSLRPVALANFFRIRTSKIGGPVCLPSAVVIGERLLPTRMVVVEFGPQEPYFDGAILVMV